MTATAQLDAVTDANRLRGVGPRRQPPLDRSLLARRRVTSRCVPLTPATTVVSTSSRALAPASALPGSAIIVMGLAMVGVS